MMVFPKKSSCPYPTVPCLVLNREETKVIRSTALADLAAQDEILNRVRLELAKRSDLAVYDFDGATVVVPALNPPFQGTPDA